MESIDDTERWEAIEKELVKRWRNGMRHQDICRVLAEESAKAGYSVQAISTPLKSVVIIKE